MYAMLETLPPEDVPGYADEIHRRLRSAWLSVLQRRAPHVSEAVRSGASNWSEHDYGDHLQAATIWFHLQQIMDENLAIRAARQSERKGSPSRAAGSFAQALASGDADTRRAMERILRERRLSVGPTQVSTRK